MPLEPANQPHALTDRGDGTAATGDRRPTPRLDGGRSGVIRLHGHVTGYFCAGLCTHVHVHVRGLYRTSLG